MHDVIIVGIPLIAIIAGILFNRADARELRTEIKDVRSETAQLRTELLARLATIESDLRHFYSVTGV